MIDGSTRAKVGCWDVLRWGWSGDYRAHGDPTAAQCVIGFAFGAVRWADDVQPGSSNEELAAFLRKHFAERPLILQSEIADALAPSLPDANLQRVGEHRTGPYLDSRAVAQRALVLMRQNGWTTALVVAHAHHVARADATCRALGIDTVVPEGLERVPFCAGSVQWWTRGKNRWRLREVPATIWYALRGWLA